MKLKINSCYLSALTLSILLAITTAKAQNNSNKSPTDHINEHLPLDPAVRTGKLSNGFTYYIRHNEEPKNQVIMYLVNKVGSVLENDNQRGLAHFMEHMSFNGTKNYPKNKLVDYLQQNGIRFGADLNAYTSFDETVYQLPLPADKPEVVANGLQIMRDWAQNAMLDPVEIDKERGVVLEEKRLGKGAQDRMKKLYLPVILNNSHYAERIPIGTDEVLNNFKPAAIKSFYHDWYRPDLQALIIVGDINVVRIEAKIKAGFANLKNPSNEKQRTKYSIPLNGQNHFIAVTDKEQTSTELEIYIKHTGLKAITVQDYKAMIIRGLFNQMLGNRFSELVTAKNSSLIRARAAITSFMGGLDCFDFDITPKPGELKESFIAAWLEIDRLKKFGFATTELARAIKNYTSAMQAAVKEDGKTPSGAYVSEYQQNFLNGTAAPGIAKEYELALSFLKDISLTDVNQLAGEYIIHHDRDILLMAPEKQKEALPNEIALTEWMKQADEQPLTAYKDEAGTASLLVTEPVPGKVTEEKNDNQLNIFVLKLSNGATVIIKPTEFRNNEILFSAFAPGGTSLYSDKDYQSAANAASIVTASGLGNLNMQQLSKAMAGKSVNIRPAITDRTQGASGVTSPQDLETALQLVYGYFTQPRKDEQAFDGIIARAKASIANRSDNPNTVFQDTVSAVLSNYNIRKTAITIEKLEQINLDNAFRIYRERFSDASNFTFLFVGNIDLKTAKPLLEKYIGGLPSTNHYEEARDLGVHIPQGHIEKTVYKGTEDKATVELIFSDKYDYSAANNMKMQAMKEALQIRLLERLREDESGVYSPTAQVQLTKLPESRYTLAIAFGCAPRNADKLIASALDEINKLKTAGPSPLNVSKWNAEYKQTTKVQLQSNKFWLGYLESQLLNKEDLNEISNEMILADQVTVKSIQETARKYLTGKNYIKLVLMPQTSANNSN
jgi:zinc protease